MQLTIILNFMAAAVAYNMRSACTLPTKDHSFLHCCDSDSHIQRYIIVSPSALALLFAITYLYFVSLEA